MKVIKLSLNNRGEYKKIFQSDIEDFAEYAIQQMITADEGKLIIEVVEMTEREFKRYDTLQIDWGIDSEIRTINNMAAKHMKLIELMEKLYEEESEADLIEVGTAVAEFMGYN